MTNDNPNLYIENPDLFISLYNFILTKEYNNL